MARDGPAGVESFKVSTFDLVLMDVQTSGVDGIAAIAAMRELEAADHRPRTPIVTLADEAADQEAQARAAGADGHIRKPLDLNELFELVARLSAGGRLNPKRSK